MLAMARDVLTCLAKSTRLDGILIVSRAPEADALAQSFGTERFSESPDSNLAGALTQATQHLLDNFNARGVAVVPADVPGIQAEELDDILATHDAVTILPDADNLGTNCLICTPPACIPYIFDGTSFRPHVDAAFAAGITPRIVPGTRFGLDVDLPRDLLEVYHDQPGSQTATYLRNAGIVQRLANLTQSQSG